MSMVRLSNVLGRFEHENIDVVNEYIHKYLESATEMPVYFTKKDGKIYGLVQKMYYTPYLTGNYELALSNVNSYIGKFYRAITNRPVGLSEKLEARSIRRGYHKGGSELKIAAWICVHSYILNTFINQDSIRELIPRDKDLYDKWNKCLENMSDIHVHILAKFAFDKNGKCMFLSEQENVPTNDTFPENSKKSEESQAEKEPVKGQKEDPKSIKTEDHPKDDPPFDQSTIIKDGEIIEIKQKKEEEQKTEPKESVNTSVDSPEKDQYLEKMAKEEAKNEDHKKKNKHSKKTKEYTFGQLKDAVKFDDPSKTAAGKAPAVSTDQIKINTMSEIIGSVPNFSDDREKITSNTKVDMYTPNNKIWENAFPGLDAFTKLIHKAGYSVQYMRSEQFPELIYCEIIDQTMNSGMGGIRKIFFIDPGLVYGDTMRMVTTDRSDGYVLGEIYLSKSQSDMIIKAIQTGLTKDDRRNINSSLPRFLHSVLYYVDMRGLQGKMKNFMVWRSFMTNLTKVVRHTPECRFRILEVESKDKFKLICDNQVKSVTYLDIYNSPDHIRESAKGLVIEYDSKKYGDKLYGMYHVDGTPLDFDPYEKKEDEKK